MPTVDNPQITQSYKNFVVILQTDKGEQIPVEVTAPTHRMAIRQAMETCFEKVVLLKCDEKEKRK